MATSKPTSKASDAKSRKIIDVTEPGKSAPTPSAKPIIVSNRPVLKRDPMVLMPDGIEKTDEEQQTTLPRASKTIKIMPLSPIASTGDTSEAAPNPAAAPSDTKPAIGPKPTTTIPVSIKTAAQKEVAKDLGIEAVTNIDRKDEPVAPMPVTVAAEEEDLRPDEEEPKTDTPPLKTEDVSDIPKPAAESEPDTTATPKVESEPEMPSPPPVQTSVPDDEKDMESGDDQLAPNQAVDQTKRKADEEKQAKRAEQEKIIDSKQYYLPINSMERQRRSLDRTILIFVFVLLLALIWLDIVMDAGILKINGVQPLTHFFKS